MVDRAALEQYRSNNNELSALVRDALEDFFLSLDLSKPDVARDALLEFTPALTAQYGDVAAVLAADYYEEMRGASGDVGKFSASLAKPVSGAAVESQVRYLAGHLWTPAPAAILGPLLTSVDKYVKQPGRDTIAANATREGARWARVPSGAKTCSFCLILASRDAVYATRQSAGDARGLGKGDDYHGGCDCSVVRISKSSDYPEGYLPDDYYRLYMDAVDGTGAPEVQAFLESLGPNATNKQLKATVFSLRRLHPDLVTDGVRTH